jgi:alcohol dehydrogenase class IV
MPGDLPLKPFAYAAPTMVWFAPDALSRLGYYLKRQGAARAMIVCDALLAERGVASRAAAAADGRVAGSWAGVMADAPVASVEAGAAEARRIEADAIVAIGGGSAIDSGKAIALLAKHGGDLARWDGGGKVRIPGLPVVAVPTTAGTGSEVSDIAVIKDAARGRKLTIIDRVVYPVVALLDPGLTLGLPAQLTAATGIDALTHAIEGLTSTHRQPICDAIGLESVRLVRAWLPRAVEAPDDLEARGFMLLAASMAGQLVSLAFSGVCHSVAHALGVGWGVHHGTANAVALPWTIRFNAGHAESAVMYARCAAAWSAGVSPAWSAGVSPAWSAGVSPASSGALALADEVERFIERLGLATRLSGVGIAAADLGRLAELAFADPSHTTNPVKVDSAAALEASLASLL